MRDFHLLWTYIHTLLKIKPIGCINLSLQANTIKTNLQMKLLPSVANGIPVVKGLTKNPGGKKRQTSEISSANLVLPWRVGRIIRRMLRGFRRLSRRRRLCLLTLSQLRLKILGFSPLCVFKCVLKILVLEDAYSQVLLLL